MSSLVYTIFIVRSRLSAAGGSMLFFSSLEDKTEFVVVEQVYVILLLFLYAFAHVGDREKYEKNL